MPYIGFNINTALICITFIISIFSIYLLKLYFSKSKKKQLNNNLILFLLFVCIIYIIILSWFIKIPLIHSKPYYLYSCFPVRIIPIPKHNETRCADVVVFNLTSPLIENKVIDVQPKQINNKMLEYSYVNTCLLNYNTIFIYYCMEYGSPDNKLYYIIIKNTYLNEK